MDNSVGGFVFIARRYAFSMKWFKSDTFWTGFGRREPLESARRKSKNLDKEQNSKQKESLVDVIQKLLENSSILSGNLTGNVTEEDIRAKLILSSILDEPSDDLKKAMKKFFRGRRGSSSIKEMLEKKPNSISALLSKPSIKLYIQSISNNSTYSSASFTNCTPNNNKFILMSHSSKSKREVWKTAFLASSALYHTYASLHHLRSQSMSHSQTLSHSHALAHESVNASSYLSPKSPSNLASPSAQTKHDNINMSNISSTTTTEMKTSTVQEM